MNSINSSDYPQIVFFTGADMSAESGIPTYRGEGGIWEEYNWEEVACEEAFQNDPQKVLEFHEIRREKAFTSIPHAGYKIISNLQRNHNNVAIITQNIDGMHQFSGNINVIELHGSIWRLRCLCDRVVINDRGRKYKSMKCDCGAWLRPDIIWFSDMLNPYTVQQADEAVSTCDLFVSIGTSGVVWPAAGYPQLAKSTGALCIELNPQPSEQSLIYDRVYKGKAGELLPQLFNM